jgi:hypothetical protein
MAVKLTEEDVAYLVARYELDETTVRAMTADGWCIFLGCDPSELRFYLTDEGGEIEDDLLAQYDEWEMEVEVDPWDDIMSQIETEDRSKALVLSNNHWSEHPNETFNEWATRTHHRTTPVNFQGAQWGGIYKKTYETRPATTKHFFKVMR